MYITQFKKHISLPIYKLNFTESNVVVIKHTYLKFCQNILTYVVNFDFFVYDALIVILAYRLITTVINLYI